jgi:hypothetical protein
VTGLLAWSVIGFPMGLTIFCLRRCVSPVREEKVVPRIQNVLSSSTKSVGQMFVERSSVAPRFLPRSERVEFFDPLCRKRESDGQGLSAECGSEEAGREGREQVESG